MTVLVDENGSLVRCETGLMLQVTLKYWITESRVALTQTCVAVAG